MSISAVSFRIFEEVGTSGFIPSCVRNLVVAYNELVGSDFHCHSVGEVIRSSISKLVLFALLLVRVVFALGIGLLVSYDCLLGLARVGLNVGGSSSLSDLGA
jgi:hypothetical protein